MHIKFYWYLEVHVLSRFLLFLAEILLNSMGPSDASMCVCVCVCVCVSVDWVITDSGNNFIRIYETWWSHHMETFFAFLAICAGNSPITGEFPVQRPVTRSSDVFFGLRLNKRLSKQSWGWRFETPSHSLWRHCNGYIKGWWFGIIR